MASSEDSVVQASDRVKMNSKKENPHSVSSILASTPRSKSKKSRKRRLHTDSLAESQGAVAATVLIATNDDSIGTGLAGCVITEFMKVILMLSAVSLILAV